MPEAPMPAMVAPKLLMRALRASASVLILPNSLLARLTALIVTAISRKLIAPPPL
ncbi:MAG: hypothetical protein QM398_09715 [Thermoproteota archaeon]|nr:hypothetical protein [Thermoproteota archaeon]